MELNLKKFFELQEFFLMNGLIGIISVENFDFSYYYFENFRVEIQLKELINCMVEYKVFGSYDWQAFISIGDSLGAGITSMAQMVIGSFNEGLGEMG